MDLKKYEDNMIKWRRHIHANPELSFKEYETAKYIEEELRKVGLENFTKPTETSLVVRIKGGKPGPVVGIRADIDALALTEDRDDLDFASKVDGVMHACGHDAHAAMLMGAGYYLNDHKDELEGDVILVFQHAEETPPGGAIEIIETGVLDDLDFIFAQHVTNIIPVGSVAMLYGRATANSDRYDIIIKGKGAHASTPQYGSDPIIIGTTIVQQLQNIISRKIDPTRGRVISNTIFQSGSESYNVIPEIAKLGGSVRTFYDEDGEFIKNEIGKVVKSVCEMYNAEYEYEYRHGYVSLINDEKATEIVEKIITEIGDIKVYQAPTKMGGEDFAYYSRKVPATFIWTGTASEGFDYPNHSPKFAVDEEGMKVGMKINIEIAKNYHKYIK